MLALKTNLVPVMLDAEANSHGLRLCMVHALIFQSNSFTLDNVLIIYPGLKEAGPSLGEGELF